LRFVVLIQVADCLFNAREVVGHLPSIAHRTSPSTRFLRYVCRMTDPFRQQTIDSWVSDFFDTETFRAAAAGAKEYAPQFLPTFLAKACDVRDVSPDELEEADLRVGLLDGVGSLTLPASVRATVPDLCGALLGELQSQGRLGGGGALGRYVRALRSAYDEKTAETVKTIRNPGERIGRNSPCPCGSGRKFKACCMKS
jgi:hypothetical protein